MIQTGFRIENQHFERATSKFTGSEKDWNPQDKFRHPGVQMVGTKTGISIPIYF